MDEGTITTLLERLGCRRIVTRGDRVRASCPDEQHHRGGMDKNPSFGILINDNGTSPSFCHACGLHDSAEWIAKKRGCEDLVLPVHVHVDISQHMKRGANKRAFGMDKEPSFLPPEKALEIFKSDPHQYLLHRGITEETCRDWELGYDSQNNRVIFIVRDRHGRLRMVGGRDLRPKPKIKYASYIWDKANDCFAPWYDYERYEDFIALKKKLVLYGEHMLQFGRRDDEYANALIIVEGYMHTVWPHQMGFNVLGTMGAYMSEVQADTVVELLPKGGIVISLADGDEAGALHMRKIAEKLAGRVPLFGVRCPDGYDAADGDEEDIIQVLGERKVLMKEIGS
jgi:hypothetical protein